MTSVVTVDEIFEEVVSWHGAPRTRFKCELHEKVVYATENRAQSVAHKVTCTSGQLFTAKLGNCGHWHIKGPRSRLR